MACGDLSRDNYHYSIQDSGVIIAHGVETWLEQGRGTRGGASMTIPFKISFGVSQWLSMAGKMISCGDGGGRGAGGGGTSIMITLKMG